MTSLLRRATYPRYPAVAAMLEARQAVDGVDALWFVGSGCDALVIRPSATATGGAVQVEGPF